MARIPVRVGQQNQVKVLTAFSGGSIPVLATNATNLVGGIATASSLRVTGPSLFIGTCTFAENLTFDRVDLGSINVSGIATFGVGLARTSGIAYFGSNGDLQATLSPSVGIQTSNLFLTTNELNVPVWTGTIDGGTF